MAVIISGDRMRSGALTSVHLPMRRRDAVTARQNLFRALRLAGGACTEMIHASSALLSARRVARPKPRVLNRLTRPTRHQSPRRMR